MVSSKLKDASSPDLPLGRHDMLLGSIVESKEIKAKPLRAKQLL